MRRWIVMAGWLWMGSAAVASAQMPIPNNDTHALFIALVEGRPFGQQTLLALEPALLAYCIQLTPPNAAGERTKIGDPISHRWTRVGFGEGRWVWVVQGDVYVPPTTCGTTPPLPPPVQSIDLTPVLNELARQQVLLAELRQRQEDQLTRLVTLQSALAAAQGDLTEVKGDTHAIRQGFYSALKVLGKYGIPVVAGLIAGLAK